MIALQNKVNNTRSGNPHNHGGQRGQKLPKGAHGVNTLAGGDRTKRSLHEKQGKTLDPLVPAYMPGVNAVVAPDAQLYY